VPSHSGCKILISNEARALASRSWGGCSGKVAELISLGLFLALISMPQAQNVASQAKCNSIEKVDFSESALSFGYQSLRFRNGKACTSDQAIADGCDWQHTLTVDQTLTPTPGQTIRLILINSNHLTGSGTWDHVFFFRCRNGYAVSEFSESYRDGVKIEKRSNTELWLVSGEWLKGDPDCCPSRQKTEIFRWDSKKNSFAMSTKSSRRRS